jgi:hypothetical protein
MEGLSVIRIKRGREDAGLGDFVVRGESLAEGDLASKLQAVGLNADDKTPVVRRVFRHVASVSESEAQALLANPALLEKRRIEVKLQRGLMGPERDRAEQRLRLKASRLRVLEEKRLEGGARVLDVESGGKRRRDEPEEEEEGLGQGAGEGGEQTILCNGQPMKRVNVSLRDNAVMVDLFVEERADAAEPQVDAVGEEDMQEVYLERFCEEDGDEMLELRRLEAEEDADAAEIDYGDSSSSGGSSDRDEFDWARSGDEEKENYSADDYERMRHFDGSIYDDEQ